MHQCTLLLASNAQHHSNAAAVQVQCLSTAGHSPHNCQQQPDPALPRTSSKWVTTNSTAPIATVAVVAKGDATISAAKAGVVVSTVSNIAIVVTTIAANTTQDSIVACKCVCNSAQVRHSAAAIQYTVFLA